MTNEMWRPIVGWERFYEVSSFGNVRARQKRARQPKHQHLAKVPVRDGYLSVKLSRPRDRESRRHYSVHALVLEAFDRPRPLGAHGNHKNGDITDNRVENLEWVTPAENIRHKIDVLGHHNRGERSGMAKLSESDVIAIRTRAAAGEAFAAMAREYEVRSPTLMAICYGQTWQHVGGPIVPKRGRGNNRGQKSAQAGDAHPGSKITSKDVVAIRVAIAAGESPREVGRRFGLSLGHVSKMARGWSWQDAGGPLTRHR